MSCLINIGNSDTPVSLIWSGQPVTIPAELMTDIGTLNVSVVGYGDDGTVRAVTKKADNIFTVVASGYVEGDEPVPDPTTILGQLVEAADNANDAADNANDAAERADAAAEAAGERVFYAYPYPPDSGCCVIEYPAFLGYNDNTGVYINLETEE